MNRIVSFLPSATELLYELGIQKKLYGVTHECEYPAEAKTKPRVINAVFDPQKMSSKEIDSTTSKLLRDGKDVFTLDETNLLNADPDLIISQNTCEVCAAYSNQVYQALQILKNKPKIHSFDPHDIEGILNTVTDVADLVGKKEEGKKLRESLEKRVDNIKNKNYSYIPKVLAIEWLEPFFTSGHWIPQMIQTAGGKNEITQTGEHSRKMNLEEISSSDPDILILMPCGFDTKRTIKEYKQILEKDPQWNKLRAVKNNNVFAVDANSYFSKPSIRTITGIEILAKIIHPEMFENLDVPENSFGQIETKLDF